MKILKFLLPLFCLLSIFGNAQPDIKFELMYSGYERPVDIASANDGTNRLFIVEKAGRIKIIENNIQLTGNFLDISEEVNDGGERGLLGLVFHPNFKENGYFFVNYINTENKTTISRFKVSADVNMADVNSEKILLQVQQPRTNHNAGDLNFSPIDGNLYIALGDGGGANDVDCYSQDSTSMLGKVLRITVNASTDSPPYYTVPSDNPYLDKANVPNEIWAFGLRNPWRVSFDRETGDYWISDVGQVTHEEVNFVPAGSGGGMNFGWKYREGTSCHDNGDPDCDDVLDCSSPVYTDPIFETNRTDASGARSITGGFVYRGCKYPAMVGKYICTDYVTDNSWYMDANGTATQFDGNAGGITTYGEDENGELYVASVPDYSAGPGFIYRVIDQNVAKTLTLTAADYPLSGSYKAIDQITVTDVINQDWTGVKFISNNVEFSNGLTIPSATTLRITSDFCDE